MKITGYSTALFSTWFFLEELGVLFDAGDGVASGLLQKSRKIKHVFITHADRDHLTGLMQFIQLNATGDYPRIYYPGPCGSFPPLAGFLSKFDPHVAGVQWLPYGAGDSIPVKKGISVLAVPNQHSPAKEGKPRSFGFVVQQTRTKLKPRFDGLPGNEIAELRKAHGDQHVMESSCKSVFAYSGDTPVQQQPAWSDVEVLIHESTFLSKEDIAKVKHPHSSVDGVLEMASRLQLKALILSHFSSRYSDNQILEAIRENIKRFGRYVSCPCDFTGTP